MKLQSYRAVQLSGPFEANQADLFTVLLGWRHRSRERDGAIGHSVYPYLQVYIVRPSTQMEDLLSRLEDLTGWEGTCESTHAYIYMI